MDYIRQCHKWNFRLNSPFSNHRETQIYATHSEIKSSPTEEHPGFSELNSIIGLTLFGGESEISTLFSLTRSETM